MGAGIGSSGSDPRPCPRTPCREEGSDCRSSRSAPKLSSRHPHAGWSRRYAEHMSTPEESHGISAVGVSRAFGDTQVVRDASLSVAPGGITALVGPNGSGKTTLMLMLATLLRPDSGAISIGGHDVLSETRAARASLWYSRYLRWS